MYLWGETEKVASEMKGMKFQQLKKSLQTLKTLMKSWVREIHPSVCAGMPHRPTGNAESCSHIANPCTVEMEARKQVALA